MSVEARLSPYRGGERIGSRIARCPTCDAPLAIHEFRDGVYKVTTIGRRFVKLGDRLYGSSKHNQNKWAQTPARQATMWSTKAPLDVHCPTPQCGNLRVHLPEPIAIG